MLLLLLMLLAIILTPCMIRWKGKKEFLSSARGIWYRPDLNASSNAKFPAGWVQESPLLTEVVVAAAGMMTVMMMTLIAPLITPRLSIHYSVLLLLPPPPPLLLLLLLLSGHLVPMNQPESALDMVTRFIENKPFL